ncbi:MAG: 4-hydroxythreonine-4-phosphate dehydrogenase PdxA, partial [bacterium]
SSSSGHAGNVSDAEAARMALSAINAAVDDIKAGKISALITAPVNKQRIQSAHHGFRGHTEYLARLARVNDAVMMFFSEGPVSLNPETGLQKQLCVSLVTTHIPLKSVPKAITRERLLLTIRRTHEALERHFACPEPRIAVLSLNPHAGEGGSIGREEETVIKPALLAAQKGGINCVGPLPADGLFGRLADFDYDAVVAMYHDQGILPIKLLCQGKCVNITLGLPYIRTSPGHGTAEDVAWLGQADAENMLSTIRLTRRLVGWTIDNGD